MKKDEKFSDLQRFILLECAKNASYPVINRRTIYEKFFDLKLSSKGKGKMFFKFDEDPKNAPSILSRSIKNLRDRGYIDNRFTDANLIGITKLGVDTAKRLQNEQSESIEADRSQSEQEPKHRPTSVIEEEPTLYLYLFGAKVFYVDPHSPEQQKRAREFRVQVTATKLSEALDRAEVEIRKQSNGFEFSIMTLFGATVSIFPPRKKE